MTTEVYTNKVAKSSETCPYPPKTPDALMWALERLGMSVRYNVRSHATAWWLGR